MNKYLVQVGSFYYVTLAPSPIDAWATVVTSDIDYYATSQNELHEKLLNQDHQTITLTNFKKVYEIN